MFRFVRLSTFLGWILATLLCGMGFLLSSFYLYLTPTLPNAEQLKTTQLQTPLRIYSSDNKRIAEFGEKRRTPIQIDTLPQYMIDAFIAAEDNRFFEHHGIDIKGLARAATQLISSGQIKSGGSTITMQVAKNFFLSRDRTFIRKFNEIFLALQIENSLSKEEILELYLNKIYLGNRAYGIHAAAKVYYGKEIQELELAEIAMIAGLPKAPSRYNPLADPERAKIRRDWILERMLELDMISLSEHNQAASTTVTATYHGARQELDAPHIAEMARQEIVALFGADAYTLGLKAYVTVDSKLQEAANQAVQNGLNNYDQRHGYRGHHLSMTEQEMQNRDYVTETLNRVKTPTNHIAALVISTDKEQAILLAKDGTEASLSLDQISWAKPYVNVNRTGKTPKQITDVLQRGDIIEISKQYLSGQAVWQLAQTPEVQGALVSISPDNGEIKALVGGYDFSLSHYNRATQAKRQPGSNFKPFVYFAALENGSTAATLINDAPIVFDDKNLEAAWRPENSSGKFYGPTRLREALYRSRNLVSIRLLKKTGVNKTLNTVQKFGFDKGDLPKDLSLALGSAAMTPLQIASGYSIIANGGYLVEPFLLSRVEDTDGNILYQANPLSKCEDCDDPNSFDQIPGTENPEFKPNPAPKIADERSIYILHSILKDVIKKGTGRQAKQLKRSDLAGKTGTTNDQKDAWFSGFNTHLETTVWVGFDNPRTLGQREYGARAALPIWIDYMKVALDNIPEAHMARPDGLVTVRIDPETSLFAMPGTQNAIFELFREEYAPRQKARDSANKALSPAKDEAIRPEDIF